MSASDWLNGVALALTLALSAYGATQSVGRGFPSRERGPELSANVAPVTHADGTQVLRDAGGVDVPLREYRRIVSATIVADRVLADLCEPDRVIAFTRHGAESSSFAHRLHGKPLVHARASVEEMLALKPDLVIVNNLVDPGYVARLREHGLTVFDLGHMRGLDTLLTNIRAIGFLIGAPARGEAYARTLETRMRRVAALKRREKAPRALYVSTYADKLFGGTARTSYHDVIVHAGLRDVATEAGYEGWPELTAERLLALDPEVVVTKVGMGAVLCRHAGLSALRPCRGQGRIIELADTLIDDPGPGMLEATEALHDAYWGAD